MCKKFMLEEFFPAFNVPDELDARQIKLLELCADIGVPFPAERFKKAYGTWWHALHEIGHWAVKPQWYIDFAVYLRDDLCIQQGSLTIPAGTVKGVDKEVNLPNIGVYQAGNDVIPDIGLLADPTPDEVETRVWSLQVLDWYSWPHPMDDNTNEVAAGDWLFHKPNSARVWSPCQKNDPLIRQRMREWGFDIPNGMFRPNDAPWGDSFRLPYVRPASHAELLENMAAIRDLCPLPELTLLRSTPQAEQDWERQYLKRRWPEEDLRRRASGANR